MSGTEREYGKFGVGNTVIYSRIGEINPHEHFVSGDAGKIMFQGGTRDGSIGKTHGFGVVFTRAYSFGACEIIELDGGLIAVFK